MAIARSVNVPSITTITGAANSGTPATLADATTSDVPLRVVVRNTGGATIRVGYSANSFLSPSALTDTWILDPGETETFVLELKNRLYAVGLGVGVASVAISPAFPLAPQGIWGQS